MLKEKVTISDFYKHEFAGIGSALMALVGDRALISVTDAANLIRKDRKHLVKWLLLNRIALLHFAQPSDSLTAIFFDNFIEFCLHEKDVADNQNAVNFLAHLISEEKTA